LETIEGQTEKKINEIISVHEKISVCEEHHLKIKIKIKIKTKDTYTQIATNK
jgi:hypothetical protein